MSYYKQCDICGKYENENINFTDNKPFMLEVKNFKNEKYIVFVDVYIKEKNDYAKIHEFICNNNMSSQHGVIYQDDDENNYALNDIMSDLKNPSPHICTKCQTGFGKYIMGEFNSNINIIPPTKTKRSKKVISE